MDAEAPCRPQKTFGELETVLTWVTKQKGVGKFYGCHVKREVRFARELGILSAATDLNADCVLNAATSERRTRHVARPPRFFFIVFFHAATTQDRGPNRT